MRRLTLAVMPLFGSCSLIDPDFTLEVRIDAADPAWTVFIDGDEAPAQIDDRGRYFLVERTYDSLDDARSAPLIQLESRMDGVTVGMLAIGGADACVSLCSGGGCPDPIVREVYDLTLRPDGTFTTRSENQSCVDCRGNFSSISACP
jgi:hypothetical protein